MEIKQYIKENEARFMEELFQPHPYSPVSVLYPNIKTIMLACALRWKELCCSRSKTKPW